MEKLITRSLSHEICKKGSLKVEDLQEDTDNGDQDLQEKYQKFYVVKHANLGLLHVFLRIAQFIAQQSVVPLLIVQMYDTYTLLCLAERSYYGFKSQYKLHLDQTAMLFSFYCSLMVSLLVTIWFNLVPWPHLESCN